MERYSVEFKKEVIAAYKQRELTKVQIAIKYQISTQTIKRWVSEYESRGIEGISPKLKNSKYLGEFKQMVIEDMINNKLSQMEASKKYSVGRGQIQNWERIYFDESAVGLYTERLDKACVNSGVQKGRKPQLDKKIAEDLIAEVQRLRAEVAYLKKLNALVSKEERKTRNHK